MQVVGPSQSGKTSFVTSLIKHRHDVLEKPNLDAVVWISPHEFSDEQLNNVLVHTYNKFPSDFELYKNQNVLIVIDDFGEELKNNSEVTNLFTKTCHHYGFSAIQITQNIFIQGGGSRTRSLNTHYLVLLRQYRDLQQIETLARQIKPRQSKGIIAAYQDAISKPYGYLLISFHPRGSPDILLRTNLFPNEHPPIVYQLKNL